MLPKNLKAPGVYFDVNPNRNKFLYKENEFSFTRQYRERSLKEASNAWDSEVVVCALPQERNHQERTPMTVIYSVVLR